ncbi:MAG: AAA family ATPase [Thermoplasmatota archaeon]
MPTPPPPASAATTQIEVSGVTPAQAKSQCDEILANVGKVFVGKPTLLRKVLAGSLANGHVLFEDYPGLGKTLLVKTFARSIGCGFNRIQFTPDILPSDIVGSKIYSPQTGAFSLQRGPVFTNVLLADEINRAPPKTQSALLEVMEERQVTIEGETLKLGVPFFVLATQNPIEQEGTYPLPEAQMDRFLIRLTTGYPVDLRDETEILRRRVQWKKNDPTEDMRAATTQEQFLELQAACETRIFVHDQVLEYISKIVRGLREHVKVELGPSPRGALALLRVSRASAMIYGREFVTPDDVKLFAVDCLAHRTLLDMDEVIEGRKPADVVDEVVQATEVPTHFRQRD